MKVLDISCAVWIWSAGIVLMALFLCWVLKTPWYLPWPAWMLGKF
jgi:hypothetical protein